MAVLIHQLAKLTLSNRIKLKNYIFTLFKNECKALERLDIIFCTDDYLLQINQTHLQHNYFTDIITFDLSPSKKSPIIAELYISVDRVKENALNLKQTFNNELHRVIFHGCLHLCGYKDKSKKDILVMRAMEEKCLKVYFD